MSTISILSDLYKEYSLEGCYWLLAENDIHLGFQRYDFMFNFGYEE